MLRGWLDRRWRGALIGGVPRSHRRRAMRLGGGMLLGRRRYGPCGRRLSSRLALLGQPRSPLLGGEDPCPPTRPRPCGLVPIGTNPHRRGLLLGELLAPQSPKPLLSRGQVHPLEGPRRSTAEDLRQCHLGESKRHTRVRDVSKSRAAARSRQCATASVSTTAERMCRMKSVQAVVEELRSARRVEKRPEDLRSSRISIIVFGAEVCVGHVFVFA